MARGWRIQAGTFGRVTGSPAAGWLVVVYRRARGGGFLVYPGVREGNGVGTFSRARRWSPPLVRDGEREQCCGGEERGGVMNRNDTVAGEYRAVVVYPAG